MARGVRVAGERVADEDRIRGVGIQFAVGLVGDLDRAEPFARCPRYTFCSRRLPRHVGLTRGIMRLITFGIENIDDILGDLNQALARAAAPVAA